MFVERTGFTFLLATGGPFGHHHHTTGEEHPTEPLRMHAYRMQFVGGRAHHADPTAHQGYYENFFQGNDPARWGSRCGVFGEVVLSDVWPGIDIRLDGRTGIKYDIEVHPGADPAQVAMQYSGMDGVHVENGELVVTLSNGSVREAIPLSYTVGADGRRAEVAAAFAVKADRVSFALPSIDPSAQLVIDPTIAFSSYSGSTGDNFGYTATYDDAGALYGGGTVFDPGYPTTLGVLQTGFAGGGVDIALSKWLPDGTALEWSTYFGGSGGEAPHSLVVNSAGELFMLGSTGSSDMPVTAGAYDVTFNGGQTINNGSGDWLGPSTGYGYSLPNGSDIVVAHFAADATMLLGSTYLGGTGNDGLNNTAVLAYNYGDNFRGEIVLDAAGSPVVATSTQSSDAPVTGGAPQPLLAGGQDAYFFRLDPGLTTLQWATFHGGSDGDTGLGVQFDGQGRMYFTGGTMSNDLPTTFTAVLPLFQGGGDGFVVRYAADGSAMQASTYLGTTGFDQVYQIQLDGADMVYVLGQTEGPYAITPGKYVVPNGNLFIQKLSNDLGTGIWSTRLGDPQGTSISPTAFLVSDCDRIYFSAWGGLTGPSMQNMPVTPDAFQSVTDGSDFYLMVLEPEATGLNYATYFGGGVSNEHVDGGTSRFDKNGTIYQAVCAGCGSNDDFPTTPGAWSNTNGSFNCNLAVFKFSLGEPVADIAIEGPSQVCPGAAVQFINNSIGGTSYQWQFDDGSSPSGAEAPQHVFTLPGTYTVTMVLSDPGNTCLEADTATLSITVLPPIEALIDPVPTVCPGTPIPLLASGGTSYQWLTTNGLSAGNVPDPVLTTDITGTWQVLVSDLCSSDTASVFIAFFDPVVGVNGEAFICAGGSTVLEAFGGASYLWAPAQWLNDPSVAAPIATPDTTTLFTVLITTAEGCEEEVTFLLEVLFDQPEPMLQDTIICRGDTVQRVTGTAATYAWDNAQGISALDVQAPLFFPDSTTRYFVSLITPCAVVRDSVLIEVQEVLAQALGDTLVCPGVPVPLQAGGGTGYQWSPAAGLSDPDSPTTVALPVTTTTYVVVVQNAIGCSDRDTVLVELLPLPFVQAGPGGTIDYGDSFLLTAVGNGMLSWDDIGGAELQDPMAQTVWPEETTTYVITVTDAAGCKSTDALTVFVNGDLYVPNSFTPNGDGSNDGFGASGRDIATITLEVFDRWGLLVWSTSALEGRWDGTYKGREAPVDTYVWKLSAKEHGGRQREAIGHVTLVR